MAKVYELIVQKLFAIRLFGAVVAGVVLAILFTSVVGILSQVLELNSKFPFFAVQNPQTAVILFLACSVTFTVLIYVLTLKEREDILTPIRKKLRGVWRVRYQTFSYEADGSIRMKNELTSAS
jgi:formate hydrogenlyase subunit 3/multisubunit Na+/H+ antiporter MnhD subunit